MVRFGTPTASRAKRSPASQPDPNAVLTSKNRINAPHKVGRNKNRPVGRRVRDVLMQFDETTVPPRFRLYAVLADPADRVVVREWLSAISQDVPADLGIGEAFDAQPAELISLELIETSYAADVSELTWRPNSLKPEGGRILRGSPASRRDRPGRMPAWPCAIGLSTSVACPRPSSRTRRTGELIRRANARSSPTC